METNNELVLIISNQYGEHTRISGTRKDILKELRQIALDKRKCSRQAHNLPTDVMALGATHKTGDKLVDMATFDIKQIGIADLLGLLNAHGVEKYALNEAEQEQEPCALADNIKAVMAEHGITQRELAKKLGTHPVVVNNTIHNPNVKVSTLQRYASAIGCTVGDFFNR